MKNIIHNGLVVAALANQVMGDFVSVAHAQQGVNVLNYVGAPGTAVPSTAILNGCQGATGELTAVTNGQMQIIQCGIEGKAIVLPYANKENQVRGATTSAVTTAVTLLGAISSTKQYVTDIECFRSDAGTSAITLTFNDTVTSVFVLPNAGNGGGVVKNFQVPLLVNSGSTFTFALSVAVSTVYCNAQGYKGT